MYVTSRESRQKSWRPGRQRVSVLAEMALRRELVVARLGELREQHSLTQEQAAARVGVTLRQWQRWEAGESMPYPRNLTEVADKFGLTIAEFFDEPVSADTREEVARLREEVAELRRQIDEIRAAAFERVVPDVGKTAGASGEHGDAGTQDQRG